MQESRFAIEDDEEFDLNFGSLIKNMYSNKKLKIAFVVKGGCLIYIAVSKNPKESISFLKKQLETLHTTLVSIATKNFVEMLK